MKMTALRVAVPILLSCGLAAGETRDDKAVAIAQNMMKAMGGEEAWQKARFVRFDFRVTDKGKPLMERSHLWDKPAGRYRLDGQNKEGQKTVALFNVNDRQGKAYAAGKELQGDAAAGALKSAYGAFINDMYWLAMPWKWLDPGVNLKYLGTLSRGAKKYEVVELSFGNVGLTPGDRYQAYVSPESGLMEFWEYTLESGNRGAWTWEYATTGGIKLASDHKNAEGRSIHMGTVRVSDSVEDSLFSDPRTKMP